MDDFGAAYNKPAPEILCAGYLSLSLQASSCCWAFHRCAYSPRRDSSSSWVPCSEMTPCHKHTNLIGVSHIGQPGEIRKTVLFRASLLTCPIMAFLLFMSMLEVASSKIWMGVPWSSTRATARRWRCPLKKLARFCSSSVSNHGKRSPEPLHAPHEQGGEEGGQHEISPYRPP